MVEGAAEAERGAQPAQPRLRNIQALRAIAALMVLFAHLRARDAFFSTDPVFPAWINEVGGSGLNLFFAISGFIMVYVTREKFGSGRSAAVFLYNRVTRIYPLLWLFTLGMIVLLVVFQGWGALSPGGMLSSLLLVPTSAEPVLAPAWTLIHEMYFYLVFALILLGPARLLPVWLGLWAAVIVVPAFAVPDYSALNPWVRIAINPLTMEFLAGCAAGLAVCGGWRRFAVPALVLGLAGMTVTWILIVNHWIPPTEPRSVRGFLYAPFVGLIVYGAAALDLGRVWSPPRFMVTLGDWSYAIYLCHWVVMAYSAPFWRWLQAEGPLDNIAWVLGMALLCIGVAGATYRLFERPTMRLAAAGRRRLFGETGMPPREMKADRAW